MVVKLDKQIEEVQHQLHILEGILDHYSLVGYEVGKVQTVVDDIQDVLVNLQLELTEKTEVELNPIFQGVSIEDCEVQWDRERQILKIYIPDSWQRIQTRPSIYIKEIKKHRNGARVKQYYANLLQKMLYTEVKKGRLLGFDTFEKCYAGFVFHFQDRHMRDPDNFMVKALIDAAKIAGIFSKDSYTHLVHLASGVYDPHCSGMSLYFSSSREVFNVILDQMENTENYIHLTDGKPCSLVFQHSEHSF